MMDPKIIINLLLSLVIMNLHDKNGNTKVIVHTVVEE